MGARGESLSAALTYSHLVFSGAVVIWAFNLLLATVRGTGNMMLPVVVVCGGALILLPLSPLLIFGFAPFPPWASPAVGDPPVLCRRQPDLRIVSVGKIRGAPAGLPAATAGVGANSRDSARGRVVRHR